MTYSIFDRHANMSEDTRFEITDLIKEISYSDEIEDSLSFNIQNSLYGLFDGYLYEDLQSECEELSSRLSTRVSRIFDICNLYPKLKTA